MARLQRLTIGEYWRTFCNRQYCENHIAWLDGFDSEMTVVQECQHPRLFRVGFSDRTETITDHNATCFVQKIPGTLRNW